MASEEFWSLTWEEYLARDERHLEEQQRWDERFGLIASTQINCNLTEGAEPKHAGFFFGYPRPGEAASGLPASDPTREPTPAESIAMMQARFAKITK